MRHIQPNPILIAAIAAERHDLDQSVEECAIGHGLQIAEVGFRRLIEGLDDLVFLCQDLALVAGDAIEKGARS